MINLEKIFYDKISKESIKLVDKLGIIGRQSNEKDLSKYGKIIF